MRRSLPPLYLPQSPLVVVLTQIRFSPVAAMETYVPRIQDDLRRKGLTEFRQEEIDEVAWSMSTVPPSAETRRFKRWEFADRKQRWLVVLTSETLGIATSAYEKYDTTFSAYVELCVDAVRRYAEPAIVTRVGLRYVDLIRPEAGLTFADYLTDRLLGLEPTTVGMRDGLAYSQLRGSTEIGAMMIRCVFSADGQVLPPDLRDISLEFDSRVAPGEKVAIVDFDHVRSVELPFETNVALEAIGELHDALDRAFRNSVTPAAIERWKQPSVRRVRAESKGES